jgi:hypothetical protein
MSEQRSNGKIFVNSEENATGNYKILQEVDAEETKNTTQF